MSDPTLNELQRLSEAAVTRKPTEAEIEAAVKAWVNERAIYVIGIGYANKGAAVYLGSCESNRVFGPASLDECEAWIDRRCAPAAQTIAAAIRQLSDAAEREGRAARTREGRADE